MASLENIADLLGDVGHIFGLGGLYVQGPYECASHVELQDGEGHDDGFGRDLRLPEGGHPLAKDPDDGERKFTDLDGRADRVVAVQLGQLLADEAGLAV